MSTNRGDDDEDVVAFTGVVGVIWHLSDVQAVVSVTHPFKSVVLFDATAFENGVYVNLRETGLQEGSHVVMDGALSPQDGKGVFRASRVSRSDAMSPPALLAPTVLASDTIEVVGVVENVGVVYGFIVFGEGLKERAFFHAKDVKRGENNCRVGRLPLSEVLKEGDIVRLKVSRSDRPSEKTKWKAIVVYV